jgi:hypothetical protein
MARHQMKYGASTGQVDRLRPKPVHIRRVSAHSVVNDVIQRTHPVGYNRPVCIPADSSVVSFYAIGILHSRWRTGFAFRINQVGVVPPL